MTDPAADDLDQGESTRDVNEPLTDAQLAESKAYGLRQLICMLFDSVLDLVYLGLFTLLAARPLDGWLQTHLEPDSPWLRLVVLLAITLGGHYLVSFPLSYYSGYRLEHQYQLSHQTFGRWFSRYLLQNGLVIGLSALMTLGLFALIWLTGPWWWLLAAGAVFVVSAILGQLVPVLILPLFYKIEPLSDSDLIARFRTLAEGTGLRLEGVYRMKLSSETRKANAMLAGLGRTRRVLLGDTLLDEFKPAELEVVLAHEIGHHVFHHINKLMLLGLVQSLASFYLCDRILEFWTRSPGAPFDYAATPVAALPLLLFLITFFSLILGPLHNGISRHFERSCDNYALRMTGDRDAYVSAFSKLARINKTDPNPPRLEVWLFHDHPSISDRLAMADPS